jgi:hypothetical protein
MTTTGPWTKGQEAPPGIQGRNALNTQLEILVADNLGMLKMKDLLPQAIHLPNPTLAWTTKSRSLFPGHLLSSVQSTVLQSRTGTKSVGVGVVVAVECLEGSQGELERSTPLTM